MNEGIYSEIKIVTVPRFKMARYVIISPNPEDDVIAYMDSWAERSGLLDTPGYTKRRIGWDFPFVTEEQTKKFGLRGYVAAYIIPEDFEPKCPGAEIAYAEEDTYATITITEPMKNPFETIPGGYKRLLDLVNNSEYKTHWRENRICFEECYVKEDVEYMDIYFPVK